MDAHTPDHENPYSSLQDLEFACSGLGWGFSLLDLHFNDLCVLIIIIITINMILV